MFNWIDEKLCTKKPDPFELKNVAELLCNVPAMKVIPVQESQYWLLGEPDIDRIGQYHLDILVKFGFDDLQIENLNVSKYGVWFYYHGDDRIMRADRRDFGKSSKTGQRLGLLYLQQVENFPLQMFYFVPILSLIPYLQPVTGVITSGQPPLFCRARSFSFSTSVKNVHAYWMASRLK